MRNLNAVALAFVAVLSLSAMAPSPAKGEHFTTSRNGVDETATLDGSAINNQVFATAEESEVSCSAMSLEEPRSGKAQPPN